jgi:uncharacterized protein YbjT (DUF2867 family)
VSVLIVTGRDDVDGLLAQRLTAQGDTVGVLVEDPRTAEHLEAAGAHIAIGSRTDEDLIERAAAHARTIVVHVSGARAADRDAVVAAISAATTRGGIRLVVWGPAPDGVVRELVRSSGLPHVIIRTGTLGRRIGRSLAPAAVAEAIDAADDLAGDVHVEVDLRRPQDWRRLKMEPPS